MDKITEDDVGKIVYSGNKTYEVNQWGRLVPVATSASYIKRRNHRMKRKMESGEL